MADGIVICFIVAAGFLLLGGEPLESVRARVAGENQLPLFAFTPKRDGL